MKKFLSILMLLFVLLTLVSCSGTNTSSTENTSDETDSIAQDTPSDEKKILVSYFSVTGNTKRVAEAIASDTGGTLFEIEPAQPYSEEDLDYDNEASRSAQENNNDAVRPEIKNKVEDMDQYSIVFLGYPIWYGKAPKIISSFLESYNFSGKTIIPFCTSGGSSIGSSATDLEGLAPAADWLKGERFISDVKDEDVKAWVDGLDF